MPAPQDYKPDTLYDFLGNFEAGMNLGIDPLLLPKNQLNNLVNGTVRGTFVSHRPVYRKMKLSGVMDFATFKFQGGCFYNPDSGAESLRAAISGRLFQFTPGLDDTAVVTEMTASAVLGGPNPAGPDQAWLWQSEEWTIWNDGVSRPIYTSDTFSNRLGPTAYLTTTTTADFVIPPPGGTATAVPLADITNLNDGDLVTIQNGQFLVKGAPTPTGGTTGTVDLVNQSSTPTGGVISSGVTVSWFHAQNSLPPGRMGAYVMGRNWVSLPNGKQWIVSDLVGGSSGTQANEFRDAVLHVTENNFLAGGGLFTVPGSAGDIRAIREAATLDASLGQGPVQIFTPDKVFSCNSPVDRLTWQSLTNPILTESLISNGALSQWSTQNANGDILFRAVDGLRSLILGRRDFDTWGNVPQSLEVDPILARDDRGLSQFSSSVVFDNRYLLTVSPKRVGSGVYHRGIVALNFDPISTLRGKAPSVYDGLWTGLNVLQLLVGEFAGVQRCFAFTVNTTNSQIELWEIMPTESELIQDDGSVPIRIEMWSPTIFKDADQRTRIYKRLTNGEIYVDQLIGTVGFDVYWKPDEYPCWTLWYRWTECAGSDSDDSKPQFRPVMGLGEPSSNFCDPTNNRPLREGFNFQIKIIIVGHCQFKGARFEAIAAPRPRFSPPYCCPVSTETERVIGLIGGGGGSVQSGGGGSLIGT